jgi:hypothetical protein
MVWHDVRPDGVLGKMRDQARWEDIPRLFRDHPERRRSLLVHGLFWRRSHADLLVFLGATIVARRHPMALLAGLPWIHGKLCEPGSDGVRAADVAALPGRFAVDVAELTAMLRGSVKHRSLVL